MTVVGPLLQGCLHAHTHTHIPVWKVGDVLACEISGINFLPKFVGVGDLCVGKEGRKKLEIAWL